jgi:hypothetical protein
MKLHALNYRYRFNITSTGTFVDVFVSVYSADIRKVFPCSFRKKKMSDAVFEFFHWPVSLVLSIIILEPGFTSSGSYIASIVNCTVNNNNNKKHEVYPAETRNWGMVLNMIYLFDLICTGTINKYF